MRNISNEKADGLMTIRCMIGVMTLIQTLH